MSADSLAAVALDLDRGLAQREADPLAYYSWAVPRLREAFALFSGDDPIAELLLRGPNVTGKTYAKACFVVACAQKRRELDGVPIPQWRGKVECMQLVLDYPQQLLSVKAAYERALGNWPHHPRYNGAHLTSIHVMPVGGDPDDESGWSPIYFQSMKNMQTGLGARADVIDFDEPPPIDFLRELRKAAHSGRWSIIIVGMTPIKRRQWAPIREDYGDQPRRSLRRVDKERAEVRWSLDEVASWVLSSEEKAKLRRIYSRDPHKGAREHGDYVNTEGSCPFDEKTIYAMIEAWCQTPKTKAIRVPMEGTSGEPHGEHFVEVEYWEPPKRERDCYQDIDPASGIDDGQHNPLALHLSDEATGDLLVRWNGYDAPYSVGALAASLSRQYGAVTDIEMKDHWGVNVLRGYEDNGGTSLCYEQRELTPGKWGQEVGFDVSAETRAIWVGCIQEWIAAFAAGVPYAVCRSRAVFECLLDMELDAKDKPVAGPGAAHAEDFVLLGQKLRRLKRPRAEAHEEVRPRMSHTERMIREVTGEQERPRRAARLLRPQIGRRRG